MFNPTSRDYGEKTSAVVGVRITDRELVECLAGRFEAENWEDIGQFMAEVFFKSFGLHLPVPVGEKTSPYESFVQIGAPKIHQAMWGRIKEIASACGRGE